MDGPIPIKIRIRLLKPSRKRRWGEGTLVRLTCDFMALNGESIRTLVDHDLAVEHTVIIESEKGFFYTPERSMG